MGTNPDFDRIMNWAFVALLVWACSMIAVGLWLDRMGKDW